MNKYLRLILLAVVCTRLAAADDTHGAVPVKISATLAAQHYDELMTVTGRVAQVTVRPTIAFINLDRPYPNSPFTAIIHSDATNRFGDLKSLKGRAVEITGTIKEYRNKPEIVLRNPDQLSVDGKPYANPHSPAKTGTAGRSAPGGASQTPPATKGTDEIM